MHKYFKTIYSIDNLVIDYYIRKEYAQQLMNYFSITDFCQSYVSNKVNKFHYSYIFSVDKENSFFVGIEGNWIMTKSSDVLVRIDFNPNKVGYDETFIDIFNHLNLTPSINKKIQRFDLAIDINVQRNNCFMFKDRRTYSEYRNSLSDRTQYLGQRSTMGRVKLYNKQIEANLDVPMTRLELTLDYDIPTFYAKACFPIIRITDSLETNLDIKGTDKILLLACMEHQEYLNELNRKKKEKIAALMGQVTTTLEFETDKYKKAYSSIQRYKNIIKN